MEREEIAAAYTSLADLDKLVIGNKRGRPIARISWSTILFFSGGETLDRRLLANRVLGDFLATFRPHVTHYHPADSSRLKPVGDLDLLANADQDARETTARSSQNENDSYGTDIYGFGDGKEVNAPAPYYFGIVATSRLRRQASFVFANFPLTWPGDENFSAVVELFVRWCGLLHPAHGTASPGVTLRQGSLPGSDFVEAYPLVQRLPGLDYVDAPRWTAESRQDQRKIRTIGWLTALDNDFLHQLGGLPSIRKELPPEIVIHPYPGGAVLQAGSKPALGDRNRGLIPALYRAVARLLQPLVFRDFPRGIFHPVPTPLDPGQETAKWLSRFD